MCVYVCVCVRERERERGRERKREREKEAPSPNTIYYNRYIDDILPISPHSLTDRLNNVELSMKFTYELKYNYTQPFLDILLIKNINKLKFKVYRKLTCKNNHIHFYSHHNNNTQRGIIIGFYLRALSICSSKYLNEEFIHIENYFLNLQYPKSFIHFAKPKALKIHNKNQTNAYSLSHKTSSPHRYITLPNNSSFHSIINNLNKLNIKTTFLTSKMICELVHSSLHVTYIQTPMFIVSIVRIVNLNSSAKHLPNFKSA